MMNLKEFDAKRVRVTDIWGDTFEGICEYLGSEYCLHEFGTDEDCLQIVNFLIYRSQIKNIDAIVAYTSPYGKIEEMNFTDGADTVEDALFCGEDEHTLRMLCCISARLTPETPEYDEIIRILHRLIQYSDSEEIKESARSIIEKTEQTD